MPFLVFSQGNGKFPWLYKYDVKTVVEKLGFFFRPYFAKTSCFHHDLRWHKKKQPKFAWQDLQKIQHNTVYVCNLVNVFLEQQQKKHGEEKICEYE